MARDNYTFGDNDQASTRLRRLAEVYEPETRELLRNCGVCGPHLAVDLGCGPGWSTRLLHEMVRPVRAVGLDSSERYISEALCSQTPDLEFKVHDVALTPFPVLSPDFLFCRFLLTHISSVGQVLTDWGRIAAPGASLVVHETETLETEHAALRRYYELVSRLQQHYGQTLLVGAILTERVQGSGWHVVESNRRVLEKKASEMAELHVANLRTWRHNEYASSAFDPSEINSLELSLERIARGAEDGGIVVNVARQIIAKRT